MCRSESGTTRILLCRLSVAHTSTDATILPMLDGSENPVVMMQEKGFRGIPHSWQVGGIAECLIGAADRDAICSVYLMPNYTASAPIFPVGWNLE